MKWLFQLLSIRLFLLLMGVMLLIFAFYVYRNIQITSSNLLSYISGSASRTSQLISGTIKQSMLLDHREVILETIRTLGSQPDFTSIHIYSSTGEIVFASDSVWVEDKGDIETDACNACHSASALADSATPNTWNQICEMPGGERFLSFFHVIKNEPACSDSDCHAHGPNDKILGVIDVKMPLDRVDESAAKTRDEMILSSLIMAFFISAISGLFVYRMVQKPARSLQLGLNTISCGDLTTRLEYDSKSEIGELTRSFNVMAEGLSKERIEYEEWTHTLEDEVAQRTQELQSAREQMVQMGKMVSLGKISASIAHEINNPLFGILTYAKLILRELELQPISEQSLPMLQNHLSIIKRESSRCGDIVKNLMDFARPVGGKLERHHLNSVFEKNLVLLKSHTKEKQISIETRFAEEDAEITCDANLCQQAFIALCINAIESMPNGGRITIETALLDTEFSVKISDTGTGIPKEILPRIFEPFFTTKSSTAGESGLGLGLSIVHDIVQRHHGRITADSILGEGTTFTITIPKEQDEEKLTPDDNSV
jgi:two-component system NtrC family sensor kinase